MSFSRRQFILGTAAGLILPSYYDKVLTYFENHGEPLLEVPRAADEESLSLLQKRLNELHTGIRIEMG